MAKRRQLAILLFLVVVFLIFGFYLLKFQIPQKPSPEKAGQKTASNAQAPEKTPEALKQGQRTEQGGFERNYPGKIKTAFVRNFGMVPPWQQGQELLNENLLAKEKLNINTYHSSTCYLYENGKFRSCDPFPQRIYEAIGREISAAKRAGLAIDSWVSWSAGTSIKLADRKELEAFLNEYTTVLVKDAKFAEKYKVEFFSLNEPDHLIGEQPFPISENEKIEIINRYKAEALPRIRAVYGGKVYYQIGDAAVWDFSKLDVSGLDFFGVLIGGECNFDEFKNNVDRVFARAESLSEKSGLPWIISELWVNKKYDEMNHCDLSGKRNPYYEYVFEKAKSSKNLTGIMIDTWNVDEPGFETSVKDTPAEQIIRSYFEEWN